MRQSSCATIFAMFSDQLRLRSVLYFTIMLFCYGCGGPNSEETVSDRPARPLSDNGGGNELIDSFVESSDLNAATSHVRSIVADYRQFDVAVNTPNWIVLHNLLMFGSTAYADASDHPKLRQRFDAVLTDESGDESAFVLRRGKPFARHNGERFNQELHRDQFLHIFSMTGVPLDADLKVAGELFAVRDLLDQSMLEIRPAGELSWTLSSYGHYLNLNRKWKNKFGDEISQIELVKALTAKEDDVCGGAHQLGAIARVLTSVNATRNGSFKGIAGDLRGRLDKQAQRLERDQQPDGSFLLPKSWLELLANSGRNPDINSGIHYTGHTVEWLTLAYPPEYLKQPWIVRAVEYLTVGLRSQVPLHSQTAGSNSVDRFAAYGQATHAVSGLTRWHAKVVGPIPISFAEPGPGIPNAPGDL